MDEIGPALRAWARGAALESLVLDALALHFPNEGALDAWAQDVAASADRVVDPRTLTAEDPRYQRAEAYREALTDLLAEVRRHWRDRHRDATG